MRSHIFIAAILCGDHHCGASNLGVLSGLQHGNLVGAPIKNENFGGANESVGNLNTSSLTTRNQRSILSNRGLVSPRKGHNEVVNVGRLRDLIDLSLIQIPGTVADRGVKQVRVLVGHSSAIIEVADIDRSQSVWPDGNRK